MSPHWRHASGTPCDDSRWNNCHGRTNHSRGRSRDRELMKSSSTWPVWIVPASALLALILFTIIFEISTKGDSILIKPENLLNILRQVSFVEIIAMGMTLVITLGGIDLSVGSLVAFLGGIGILLLNSLLSRGTPEFAAVVAAFALIVAGGVVAGLINGLLVSK